MSETAQKPYRDILSTDEGETQLIKETDWTDKTLEEVRSGLVEKFRQGICCMGHPIM